MFFHVKTTFQVLSWLLSFLQGTGIREKYIFLVFVGNPGELKRKEEIRDLVK